MIIKNLLNRFYEINTNLIRKTDKMKSIYKCKNKQQNTRIFKYKNMFSIKWYKPEIFVLGYVTQWWSCCPRVNSGPCTY